VERGARPISMMGDGTVIGLCADFVVDLPAQCAEVIGCIGDDMAHIVEPADQDGGLRAVAALASCRDQARREPAYRTLAKDCVHVAHRVNSFADGPRMIGSTRVWAIN